MTRGEELGNIIGLKHTGPLGDWHGDFFAYDAHTAVNRSPQTLMMLKEWCRHLFHALAEDGGEWTIPRSNSVFERRGNVLVAVTPEPWDMTQKQEFLSCYETFGWAGIRVVVPVELAEDPATTDPFDNQEGADTPSAGVGSN